MEHPRRGLGPIALDNNSKIHQTAKKKEQWINTKGVCDFKLKNKTKSKKWWFPTFKFQTDHVYVCQQQQQHWVTSQCQINTKMNPGF